MNRDDRIYVAGHRGLVGSALVRALEGAGYHNLVLRTRDELDLCRQAEVEAFFARERPDYVFLAAARVGGIAANQRRPADFLRDNLEIQTHVLEAARRSGVRKLLFLGSSCIYPREAPQPIPEEALLTGPLEETNRWYAIAKIAGMLATQAWRRQYGFDAIAVMPTNLYGPGDNFHPEDAHVLPALLRRFHEAREAGAPEVVVWGSGRPRREFLHVDDLAAACLMLMEEYSDEQFLNVGTGTDISIAGLAELIAATVGYRGRIRFDTSRPDGTPRKRLDVSRIRSLGWAPRITLPEGIADTYRWFLEHRSRIRG